MSNIDFTVEETNLVDIYLDKTLAATLAGIAAALPDMDGDFKAIAQSASRKLATLTEQEFSAIAFIPADETDG